MTVNSKDRDLRERARAVIPNGMYGHESAALLPADFPQFFARGDGARIWDVDGNEYVDFMCAFGPNLLGYNHPEVERAARAQAALGDTLTGPSEPMVVLAETFVSMISHAAWAMFCKNGSDATSMAMVIARAHTGRRKILVATGAYHGASVWSTPNPTGTLPDDRAHIIQFRHNDAESLADAIRRADGDVAAVFATPFRHEVFEAQDLPTAGYAREVRRQCDQAGALLIVDEVRAGFRLSRDASWTAFGVDPDLTTWGKVLGNGHPISALLGAEHLRAAAGSIYVTGSFWFSAVPMAAAVATLGIVRDTDYLERMIARAGALRAGLAELATTFGFDLRQTGPAQMPQIFFGDDPDFRIGYFWAAAALRRGAYFHPYHNMFATSALTEQDIAKALSAAEGAFAELRKSWGTIAPQANAGALARIKAKAMAR